MMEAWTVFGDQEIVEEVELLMMMVMMDTGWW